MTISSEREVAEVARRYARRATTDRYSFLKPDVWQSVQERQRMFLRLFASHLEGARLAETELVEIGCGSGGNLLEFLRMGFSASHLTGIELLPERVAAARRNLPVALNLLEGDARSAPIEPGSKDIVFQAVVFSSLLDDDFQEDLARRMWTWLRPGGAILWYDFTFSNPANPDVRGVSRGRVAELFPQGKMTAHRVTLAPPVARRVAAIHPALYSLLNVFPFLRTHLVCWIKKP